MAIVTESDKIQILSMYNKGMDVGEIGKKMKTYTRQQIAAIRAWATMRSEDWKRKGCKKTMYLCPLLKTCPILNKG